MRRCTSAPCHWATLWFAPSLTNECLDFISQRFGETQYQVGASNDLWPGGTTAGQPVLAGCSPVAYTGQHRQDGFLCWRRRRVTTPTQASPISIKA
jgi:hypothetical protein